MRFRVRLGIVAAALSLASCAQAAKCDRDCLSGFVTQYLSALATHHWADLPISANFRLTEDTVPTKLGDSALWRDTSKLDNYRLDIVDVREGVAAAQAIVEESGMPAMLMLRLKVADGKLTEAETQITRNKTEGSLFKPEALKSPSAAMLLKPDPSQRNSREEMIKIAEHYPAGLKAGSFITVDAPFAPDTYRFENGQLMAGPGCTFLPGCENIKTQKVPTLSGLTYRLAAVDEDLGIVLFRLDFGPGSTRVAGDSLVVWEAFKVYGGQIHAVEAFMKNMPLGTPSGWDSPGK